MKRDRNTNTILTLSLLILAPRVVLSAPSIQSNGVLNASSQLADIARGSWFVVLGTGLGPSAIVVQSGPPFPTTLAGTSITFTPSAGGTAIHALMYYTLDAKVAGLLPSSTPAGTYNVRVTYNGQTSSSQSVKVVERNFGFATEASNGQGPAQATYGGYDLNRFTTGSLAQWSLRPATTNDHMILWGTGLGADAASDVNGGTSGDKTADGAVRVIVGGIEVIPAYAGRSSGSPGLDQINFTVPSSVTPNCFVSLQVRAGGRLSNLGSIAVAPAGQANCVHPVLTAAQLAILDRGGSLVVGDAEIAKHSVHMVVPNMGSIDEQTESASASFEKITVDEVGYLPYSLLQIGVCTVISQAGLQTQYLNRVAGTRLDAGPQLLLNGPNASKAVPRLANKTYFLQLYASGVNGLGASGTPTITQGTYTLTGTGGTEIGPFSASADVPGTFTWTNEFVISDPIPRNAPLTITWTGGGAGLVSIAGDSGIGAPDDPNYDWVGFSCATPAAAGSLTIPASILSQLPAVSNSPGSGTAGALVVAAIPDATQGAFSAPVIGDGSTSVAFMRYVVEAVKSTGWQ